MVLLYEERLKLMNVYVSVDEAEVVVVEIGRVEGVWTGYVQLKFLYLCVCGCAGSF